MNNKYGISFEKDLKNRLKDKKFAKAWKESEPEYNLACQLIELRQKENLSQRDLAKKIKTSQVAISRIETMTGNPSLKLLKRLSLALNTNLNISFN